MARYVVAGFKSSMRAERVFFVVDNRILYAWFIVLQRTELEIQHVGARRVVDGRIGLPSSP